MLLLGIETSTTVSSVALWRDDGQISTAEVARGRGHVELLVPTIERLYEEAGLRARDLTGIAVGIGPGLFTSMRVGIVTAKTLAQALGRDVVGISSLDTLAFPQRNDERLVCACIDARRGEVFAATYRNGERISEPALWGPRELHDAVHEGTLFVGETAVMRAELGNIRNELSHPRAEVLCEMAGSMFARGEGVPPEQVAPLYVRRTDAEIKWEQRGVTIERPLRVKPRKHALEQAP